MATFVQIVVNVPAVSGVFDYAVPQALLGKVGVGHLVVVPFGNQTVQGVIFRFISQPSVPNVKEIIELVDPEPVLTHAQIALAEAMAEHSLSPLASIVGLFLPSGLNQQVDTLYEIRNLSLQSQKSADPTSSSSNTQKLRTDDMLLNLLRLRGPLRGRQIDTHFSKVDWRKAAHYLVRKGILSSRSVFPRRKSPFFRYLFFGLESRACRRFCWLRSPAFSPSSSGPTARLAPSAISLSGQPCHWVAIDVIFSCVSSSRLAIRAYSRPSVSQCQSD